MVRVGSLILGDFASILARAGPAGRRTGRGQRGLKQHRSACGGPLAHRRRGSTHPMPRLSSRPTNRATMLTRPSQTEHNLHTMPAGMRYICSMEKQQ